MPVINGNKVCPTARPREPGAYEQAHPSRIVQSHTFSVGCPWWAVAGTWGHAARDRSYHDTTQRHTKGEGNYLLGSKSKSIEKCPVTDNCTGTSRLLGHTKKLKTVTELSLGGKSEILSLGWPTTRFGFNKILASIHFIFHYVAQY